MAPVVPAEQGRDCPTLCPFLLFKFFENLLRCIVDYGRRPWCPYSVDCGRIHQNNTTAWSLHRTIGLCCNEHAKGSQGRCSLEFASVPAQDELASIFKLAFGRYQPEDIRIEGSSKDWDGGRSSTRASMVVLADSRAIQTFPLASGIR
jgi:hypothetical protein